MVGVADSAVNNHKRLRPCSKGERDNKQTGDGKAFSEKLTVERRPEGSEGVSHGDVEGKSLQAPVGGAGEQTQSRGIKGRSGEIRAMPGAGWGAGDTARRALQHMDKTLNFILREVKSHRQVPSRGLAQ